MQRTWKRRWLRVTKTLLSPVAAGLLIFSSYSMALANPTGAAVTSGAAAISTSGSTLTVNQTTNKAVINWQSFSIGNGETVNFIQPGATSIALNRVIGNDASAIYGTLNANGKVYLINPNGILFAKGAQVNVGGLVASTLNLSDSDFLSGSYTWQKGGSGGAVINQGTISAANEAVLIGPKVANEGVIAAKVTGLAAGNKVSLDFSGDQLLSVTVDTGAAGGSAVNSGAITATGGLAVMSAGTADALLGTVVNNSGVIRAQSVTNAGGVIRLEGGTVTNSGVLDASGKASGQTGGTVKMLGDTITLASGSIIDVSGDAGGGTALIGGAYQGGDSEYTATTTTVENGATINADAITTGNGGQVVVWANDTTNYAGIITARGGSVSGDGGNVETSGKQTLKIDDSAVVNTLAANGKTGNWLLDPTNFTIASTGGDMTGAALSAKLNTTNVEIKSSEGKSGTNGNINVNDSVSWSADTTLTLTADNNININKAVTATGGNAGLTLTATGGDININAPVTLSGVNAALNMTYDGDYNILTKASYSGAVLDSKGNPIANTDTSGGVYGSITLAGSNASLNINGNAYTLIHSMSQLDALDGYNSVIGSGTASTLTGYYALAQDLDISDTIYTSAPISTFNGTLTGLGHSISNLTITSTKGYLGLIGTTNSSSLLRDIGLLNVKISAGGSYAGALVGYNQGNVSNAYSTGSVTGSNVGGLIGYNIGTDSNPLIVRDCYSNATVYGRTSGGLIGKAAYTNVYNSHATGAVSSDAGYSGGLIAQTDNVSVYNSYATGNVTGAVNADGTANSYLSYATYLGGLIGYAKGATNNIYIDSCFATGKVTGFTALGGLLGYISITDTNDKNYVITNSYHTTGDVIGNMPSSTSGTLYDGIGGLVGYYTGYYKGTNSLIISDCYATGAVKYSGYYGNYAGGLVGNIVYKASITDSYAVVDVSGGSYLNSGGFGGLVGAASSLTTITNCYAGGKVSGARSVGGLVGANSGVITNSYASGNVSGFGNNLAGVGGLVGTNTFVGSIIGSYATGDVSGAGGSASGGLVGSNAGRIDRSYSSGGVNAPNSYTGGIAGINFGGGIITDSYYNASLNSSLDQTSDYIPPGQTAGMVDGGGGLTELQMRDVQYYANGTIDQVTATRAAAQVAAGDQQASLQQINAQAVQTAGQMSAPATDPLQNLTAGLTPKDLLQLPGMRPETLLDTGSARIQSVEVNGIGYQLEEDDNQNS